MRVKNENNNFFKTSNTSTPKNKKFTAFEKHRLWLNLSNDTGAFSQILIGYAEGATSGWDRGLDGKSFGGNDVTFYSIASEDKLTIQAKPLPFTESDVIPLGFKAISQNAYRIGIDHFDALFENQQIYLKDNDLNIIHDLKANPYSFSSDAGTFNERFEIVFTTQTLSVENYSITEDDTLKIISNNQLTVLSENKTINKIIVSDVLGRLLKTYKGLNTKKIALVAIEKANRGLIIQVIFSDDASIFKKVIY
ncbi:hypothetical protein N7U66_17715 [Lacinutrix neustonica]|uniref:Uncharacterized protein n=1 Tax=Lacinutrix neustonica TaxID=2980107 RepID=A0A9E8MUD1_9FLAO|nr:hypothetical protein [Lacinutrix neustonica]WAC01717.1 hypothetical protein N7U66_17715 [Lacinutrix neustonica]